MAKAKVAQARKKLGGAKTESGHREAKVSAVEELQRRLIDSPAVILTEYRGMTVGELAELRASLREGGADYKVYKNTLARIAARNAGVEELVAHLDGPTAFAFVAGDPVVVAKRLTDFAKRVPALVLKGGVLERRVLASADVAALATLDSREVMLARVAGMMVSPIQQLANLLAAGFNQLGSLLVQLREKLPPEGAPEAAPEPEPEAPSAAAEPEPEAPAPEAEAHAAPEPEAPAPEAEAHAAPEAEASAAPESEAPPAEGSAPGSEQSQE